MTTDFALKSDMQEEAGWLLPHSKEASWRCWCLLNRGITKCSIPKCGLKGKHAKFVPADDNAEVICATTFQLTAVEAGPTNVGLGLDGYDSFQV